MAKILLVEDEEEILEFMQAFLMESGFSVDVAGNGVAAYTLYSEGEYDLVVSDVLMPRLSGIELLEKIKKDKPDQPVILITGVNQKNIEEKAREVGCTHYITKPIDIQDVIKKINECIGGNPS